MKLLLLSLIAFVAAVAQAQETAVTVQIGEKKISMYRGTIDESLLRNIAEVDSTANDFSKSFKIFRKEACPQVVYNRSPYGVENQNMDIIEAFKSVVTPYCQDSSVRIGKEDFRIVALLSSALKNEGKKTYPLINWGYPLVQLMDKNGQLYITDHANLDRVMQINLTRKIQISVYGGASGMFATAKDAQKVATQNGIGKANLICEDMGGVLDKKNIRADVMTDRSESFNAGVKIWFEAGCDFK